MQGCLDRMQGFSGDAPPEGGGDSSQDRTMASISISTAGSVSRDGCPVIMHTIARRK